MCLLILCSFRDGRCLAHNAPLCYIERMDITIRNLDQEIYRALKARAALAGRNIGDLVNEALQSYLASPAFDPRSGSLRDLTPERYPEGNDRLSEEVDAVVYGA